MKSGGKSESFVEAAAIEWETAGDGVRRRILGHNPDLMMVYVEFKAGAVGYVHKHHHHQVTFVESGKFEVQIGDRKKVLGKGDSYIVEPEVPHGARALEAGNLVDIFTPARTDFLEPED